MKVATLSSIVGFLILIAGSTVSVMTFFETKADAAQARELLAADSESDRLRTRLELIDIKLQRYKDLADVRDLTESEKIDLRSLEAERTVILGRLAAKG